MTTLTLNAWLLSGSVVLEIPAWDQTRTVRATSFRNGLLFCPAGPVGFDAPITIQCHRTAADSLDAVSDLLTRVGYRNLKGAPC
jgi:hypothetical protein